MVFITSSSQWCFARRSLAPLRNKELSPSCGFKVMWPGPPVGLYLAPGAWRALCMREYTLLHITFSFRCQQCIKSPISSFAPKAAFLHSLRDDSVVHWTQAWCLVLKKVVKLFLNFGENKCSLFHETLLHPTH